jgi:pimeloyl-ACP methyl ester carboxylesterase
MRCWAQPTPSEGNTQNDKDLTKELYIFSGLGADESVFHRLDFSGFSTTFIKWIVPQKTEIIEHYATRLLDQITTTKPILIGLSFGGLIAVEVAKQIETEKVILIASAKTKKEIPFYYRFAGQLRLHKLLPTRLLKRSNFVTNWFFGTSSTFDKQLLKQILLVTDPTFLKWAIDKIVRWTNQTQTQNIFHIHGTSDRILPLCFVNCNQSINNGGHLMTLNKSEELNTILRQLLLQE